MHAEHVLREEKERKKEEILVKFLGVHGVNNAETTKSKTDYKMMKGKQLKQQRCDAVQRRH